MKWTAAVSSNGWKTGWYRGCQLDNALCHSKNNNTALS